MKPIYFGKKESGEDLYLDLEKEGIHFISLLGATASGKSVFHENLYKELTDKYTPEELGFIFMDMTRVDFVDWRSPEYLIKPTIVEPDEALNVLGNVKDDSKIIFIHIEECDMAFINRAKMEKGLDKIRKKENIFLVYSTSRIDQSYLKDWMDKYFDLNIIFRTAAKEDSQFLLGNENAFNFEDPGERILAFNDKQIKLVPF